MKYGIVVVSLLLFGGLGVYVLSTSNSGDTSSVMTTVSDLREPAVIIVRTNEGYAPNEVVIQQGEVVLWKNESDDYHWPASDLHPTHGIYPEFDPLRPIAPGEEWKFKFDQVGEWKFHDHIRANKVGTITVLDENEQAFDLKEGQILEETVIE